MRDGGLAAGVAPAQRVLWTRAGARELLANAAAIALIPLLGRLLIPVVEGPLRGFGFGDLLDALLGRGGFTDIGIEVAASRGLVDRAVSAYDPTPVISLLTGMTAYGDGTGSGHTHPPVALPLGIPLAYVDYSWWLSFWVVAAVCALALSMRVMQVPAWVAYPLAVGICLTPSGMRALVGTYTVTALLLALAWSYRWHPIVAGLSYALLAASRGVAVVLLAYPLVKRQWRTLLVALGTLFGLLVIALAFEPTVVRDFLTMGRASIEVNVASPDLYTFDALASRRGVPRWAVWGLAAAVVAIGVIRRREVFWLSVWFMLAVTPIVWWSTPVMALPLFVVMWQSGRIGRFLSLLVGVVFVVGIPAGWNVVWPVVVVVTAVAVLACPLGLSDQATEVEGAG